MLIDIYQWDVINEWIFVKIEDRTLEILVKEFGSEVYSVQSHPDREEETSISMERTNAEDEMVVLMAESEQSPVATGFVNLNLLNVVDPVINAMINDASDIIGKDDMVGTEFAESKRRKSARLYDEMMDQNSGFGLGLSESDPMILEAQIAARSKKVALETEKKEEVGLTEVASGPWMEGGALSCSSCPYPPGFGPCSKGVHVHHVIRAQNSLEIVYESPFVEGDHGCEASSVNESPLKSDEVNETPPHEEEECSEETLYRINPEAIAGIWDDAALAKNIVIQGLEIEGSIVANVNHVEETQASDTESAWVKGESATEEFWDDDDLIKASESKKVWDKGGIFFDSSGEEEILEKLTDRKVERKKQRKKPQGRKLPCIQGTNLATRKLRLGAKTKIK
ncbi:hypothetical protein PIB30_068608 [Stylosanthes scabra]|uniref:Uncharacterized protein n=1 Tax=Stylosanthes scabra TaxID=79078 RepID=A0ABU6XKS0_9FABA|nr:hypothetical protein [Stylosanthes scabra]